MYDQGAARRILAGHLRNVYAGTVPLDVGIAHVRKLGTYAGECADVELETMAAELANLLERGDRPTLVLPELAVQVAPDPASEVSYAMQDGELVLEETEAQARRDAELEALADAAAAAAALPPAPSSPVLEDEEPAVAPAPPAPPPAGGSELAPEPPAAG
ncbi:MAG: hypothetical protein AB7N73_15040 [Gemmatimonadales bacterium]